MNISRKVDKYKYNISGFVLYVFCEFTQWLKKFLAWCQVDIYHFNLKEEKSLDIWSARFTQELRYE